MLYFSLIINWSEDVCNQQELRMTIDQSLLTINFASQKRLADEFKLWNGWLIFVTFFSTQVNKEF